MELVKPEGIGLVFWTTISFVLIADHLYCVIMPGQPILGAVI